MNLRNETSTKRSTDETILLALANLVKRGEKHFSVYRIAQVAGVEKSTIYARLNKYYNKTQQG